METPKSKFIKNQIKNLEFNRKNKEYIEDLIFLEQFILEGNKSGWIGGMQANNLKSEYRKEYEAIYKELKPREFEKEIKRELKEKVKERQEERQFKVEEQKELKQDKILWKKLGGKI